MTTYNLIATTASGIEALAANELKTLGYHGQTENGRIRFTGDIKDIIRTNLWLRTADRIKIVVGEFKALTFDDLFEQVKALPWDDYLPLDAEFPVAGRSIKSKLYSVPDVQRLTKKAIVEKMSQVYHRRGRLPETGALFALEVSILKDHVMLTLDTTGPSLFKRGYRVEKGDAPLKENMAAALVAITNWHTDMPFLDPVCGSGTIPIEAALKGLNIAPGLKRAFSFEGWDWVPAELVADQRAEAAAARRDDVVLDIMGADIDGSMIEIARLNANEAGVLHDIDFKQLAVKDFRTAKHNGVIVANPPYGERLSDANSVHRLYQQMGDVYRPLTSWSKYILTSDLQFETYYGEKATKRRKLYNGALRTDLFQFWGKRVH
ncbi:THUMP domain-containing class I SAM-dependent RNA methyltransferase [Loigolactobacillus coryniformis]|uniref:Site-specific DNA-methyltransferase n=1 Tax=Loigolactobacillus coryniformis subsp. coryniformis CECT 5711 TaxID=1185325 RepID=J3JBZ7_9LACO|nr:class I SAM-dependent RNA methyltransferase [Loigolactobacillus coryniformis]EJN56174.1 Site-specific DNA-methyltransferase [Loigolactobacillus coryniformis subsp. coryniformis CECT 5711]